MGKALLTAFCCWIAFIQAKNLHYGLDFCPAFWDWLVASNEAELVFSIERAETRSRLEPMSLPPGLPSADRASSSSPIPGSCPLSAQ